MPPRPTDVCSSAGKPIVDSSLLATFGSSASVTILEPRQKGNLRRTGEISGKDFRCSNTRSNASSFVQSRLGTFASEVKSLNDGIQVATIVASNLLPHRLEKRKGWGEKRLFAPKFETLKNEDKRRGWGKRGNSYNGVENTDNQKRHSGQRSPVDLVNNLFQKRRGWGDEE